MEHDPPSKKSPAAGDGLIDLPLGPRDGRQAPAAGGTEQRPPTGDPQPAAPGAKRRPGDMGKPGTTPRHQAARGVRRGTRRRRKAWPWLLLLLLIAAATTYWLLFLPPVAEASSSALEFGPTRVGRQGEEAVVEVFNRGRQALRISAVEVSGEAAQDYSLSEDRCTGASLGPDQACAISLAFEPGAPGLRGAALEVTNNAASVPLVVGLSGTGLAPALASAQQSLDFGRIAVGKASETEALVFSNAGTAPLAIARMAVEGSGESSFVWVANGCSGETLAPGAECSVRLAFKPRDAGGFKAEARVWSDAAEDPRVVLSGIGVAPGLLILPSELDFGELRPGQRSTSNRVQFENTGNAALEIERVELAGADPQAFSIGSNDCDGRVLAAEDRCSVAVRYQPSDPARHQAVLRVRAPELKRRREVALQGAALAPRLALGVGALDFGQVTQYATNENTLELRNTGSAPLDFGAIDVDGAGGSFGVSDRGCPPRLEAGSSCTLGLRFSPSRVGDAEARLRIAHNAPGSPAVVRMRGVGVALPKGEIAVEPRRVDFGALPVGERSDILTIKVRSVGNARLDLSGYSLTGAGAPAFQIVPASCEGLRSLLPGSDCTIGVRFRPLAGGRSSASVEIRHAGGTFEVTLSGEGF